MSERSNNFFFTKLFGIRLLSFNASGPSINYLNYDFDVIRVKTFEWS